MSTEIEQRVLEMHFDNKRFENNVSVTMSTLDKLKQKLNFTGVSKGLEDVSDAAGRINMGGLGRGVESVMSRFSALEVIGVTALANIANSAVNASKRMLSALTLDPIKTGFSEYETQMNSIQTILANTESKGTTLDDVSTALDTLNEYADKTIYNFTQMTKNIGTFTAAGIDLETSVNAIQGIANLAAVSGSNSQQASTAMYQLSQALASGTVKLMDWNSVVNAGMGGQVFQDALKETARAHGVAIDDIIEKQGSFRNSLSTGWLSAEILTDTLQKFTMATEGLTEAEIERNREMLRGKGYTDAQIDGIFKLGNTATNAATKVKTFTQLWETLKESAQSGWAQTWEIVVGDFEEAKSLLTSISEVIGGILSDSSKARNELLQNWKDAGGRKDLIIALERAFNAVLKVSNAVKRAFHDIFPPLTVENLLNFTNCLKQIATKANPSMETLENIERIFKGIFAVLDIGRQALVALFKVVSPLFGSLGNLSGSVLEVAASLGDWLVELNESVRQTGFFAKIVDTIHIAFRKIGSFLMPVVDGMKEFTNAISGAFVEISDTAKERLGPLSILGKVIGAVFAGLGNVLKTISPYVYRAAVGIGNALREMMDIVTMAFQNADFSNLFDFVNGGILTAIGAYFVKFARNISVASADIWDIFDSLSETLNAFTSSIKADTLQKIATAIGILAASLLVISFVDSEKLTGSLVAVAALFGELMGAMSVFTKIIDGKSALKLIMVSGTLKTLASAILVLGIALKIMGSMSWSEMGVGLISLTVGLGAMVGAVQLLPETKVNGAARAIRTLSTSMLVLAIALKIMGSMSWSEMGVGLISMAVGLGALVAAVNLLPKDTALRAVGMTGLATAMVILGAALKIMGSMSWGELGVGLAALAGSLIILVGAMALMKDGLSGALAMLVIAPALIILAGALKIMSAMSWGEIARGLVALGGALVLISGAMYLMTGALPGAAALIVVSGALAILAPVMKVLGSMSWGEIARGLVAIAGAFAVIGVAGLVLGPLVPVILSLAGAIALLGLGASAIGAGILMLGAGLTMISVAGSAAAVSLVTIVASIIGLIPYMIEQIGIGIVKLCEVIGGSGAAIFKAAKVLILAFVDAIVASVPALVDGAMVLITGLLDALVTYLPQIGGSLIELIVQLLDIITANVPTLAGSVISLIVAVIESITAGITQLVDPLLNLVETIFQGIADIMGPIIETVIIPILDMLADAFDTVFNGIATVVTSVGDSIKSVLDGIAGVIDSIGEAALNAGTGFENLANGVKIITGLKLADMVASLAAVASGIGDIAAHADGLVEVSKGMRQLSNEALSTATSMITKVIAIIRNEYSDFYDAGGYVVDGFASGIDDNTWKAEAKAKAMAKAAIEAAEEELDVNSPSREFYRVGSMGGLGFVNALADYARTAFGAGSSLAEAATNGLNKTVSRLSDIIDGDIDVQPVIRPVLDLSSVRSGVSAIDGMFSMRPSVGVLSTVGSISASMNQRGQNGSNGDVVSAINQLSKRLSNIGNTYYNVDGVTYDDGSNVADAVKAIARYAIRERRV